jgi:hypothetical protein
MESPALRPALAMALSLHASPLGGPRVNDPSAITDFDAASSEYDKADEVETARAALGKVRPLGGVRRFLKWAMILFLLGETGNGLVAAAYMAVYSGFVGGSLQDNLARIDLVRGIVVYPYFGGFFLAVFAYLWFVFRAMSNLIRFSPRFIRGSGASAVIWHFVPLVCLAKPYAIMSQLWVQSNDPSATGGKAPATIGWWWVCWLLAGVMIATSLTDRNLLVERAGDPDAAELFVRYYLSVLLSAALTIASVAFLLPITRDIARAQDDHNIPAAFGP